MRQRLVSQSDRDPQVLLVDRSEAVPTLRRLCTPLHPAADLELVRALPRST
jgi:hypothetical protein